MSTKLEYLKYAIGKNLYREGKWIFTIFATADEAPDDWKSDPFPGRLVRQSWGYAYVPEMGDELVKITDADPKEPLFRMQDPIMVDIGWAINAPETPVESNVGALMSNLLLLCDYYGKKIAYRPYRIDMREIESYIIQNRAVDRPGVPRDPTKIYLDEYLRMGQAVEFVRTLTPLSTSSLTDKNMTMPDGLAAQKKQLLKEKYNNDLSDPVKLAEFEAEMLGFAREYLKDDPSFGKLVKGKYEKNALRKMFVSSGAEGGMGGDMVSITESLADGLTYSPKQLQALINGARSGSYFRGLDTVKGGVSFKLAVRVLSAFYIGEDDCGTNLGLEVTYDKTNIKQLVSRSIFGNGENRIQSLEEASNYMGKVIRVRSPGYCKSKSSVYCKKCAGPRLSKFPEGLAIPASEITGIILAASMAAMHKNTTEVTTLDLSTSLS